MVEELCSSEMFSAACPHLPRPVDAVMDGWEFMRRQPEHSARVARTFRILPFCPCTSERTSGNPHPSLPWPAGGQTRALAGCGKTYLPMKNLSAPCDKTGFLPLVL